MFCQKDEQDRERSEESKDTQEHGHAAVGGAEADECEFATTHDDVQGEGEDVEENGDGGVQILTFGGGDGAGGGGGNCFYAVGRRTCVLFRMAALGSCDHWIRPADVIERRA